MLLLLVLLITDYYYIAVVNFIIIIAVIIVIITLWAGLISLTGNQGLWLVLVLLIVVIIGGGVIMASLALINESKSVFEFIIFGFLNEVERNSMNNPRVETPELKISNVSWEL